MAVVVVPAGVRTGANQITESYAYETLTGLLSNQKVQRGAITLLDLSYNYLRAGTTAGRTGQLTKITNNLDSGKDRGYEYDALGRLKKATGGATATWTQTYTYDKHGNRTGVTATGTADNGTPIPRDGFATLAVSLTTNQITGWLYDKAGNQVRAQAPGGGWQRYQYDAANRLVKVKADDNVTVLASYTYGDSNERLIADEGGLRTYYACDGKVEYTESGSDTTPGWSKSYVYLGGRLLSTLTPNGSGGEFVQYHHPDRLGTRLVSNAQDTTSFEQVALPFGTALTAESTGSTNRRFTTYDRSATTGLDYAMNRHYDSQQGRFTQVDPIGMQSTSLANPQTLNLYAYCTNDPINHTDPSGLGFFSFLKRLFKKIFNALKAALVAFVVAFVGSGDFRRARRTAVRTFVSELGFRTRTWRTTGTPPTFPVGVGRPALHQIFQGTLLAGLFPAPESYMRWVNGWAGGPLFKPNCPPTGIQLANNQAVQRALLRAWRDSQHGTAQHHEEGGWLYWNPDTSRIIVRRALSGTASSIDLRNPSYVRGAFVIATFHTHPYGNSNISALGYTGPSGDDEILAYWRNVPGLVFSQHGIWVIGPARWGSNPERAKPSIGEYPGNSVDSRKNCP